MRYIKTKEGGGWSKGEGVPLLGCPRAGSGLQGTDCILVRMPPQAQLPGGDPALHGESQQNALQQVTRRLILSMSTFGKYQGGRLTSPGANFPGNIFPNLHRQKVKFSSFSRCPVRLPKFLALKIIATWFTRLCSTFFLFTSCYFGRFPTCCELRGSFSVTGPETWKP